jgi:hypothetical protein
MMEPLGDEEVVGADFFFVAACVQAIPLDLRRALLGWHGVLFFGETDYKIGKI